MMTISDFGFSVLKAGILAAIATWPEDADIVSPRRRAKRAVFGWFRPVRP